MNNTSSPLKAFKRVTSLELSKWYMGMLLTNPAETPDTNGAFSLLEATLVPGTEPPPHVHTREDELFYVLKGEFDLYVGEEAFNGKTGECIFLPRFKPQLLSARLGFACSRYSPPQGGRNVPQRRFACPKSGTPHGGACLFDGRLGADCATSQCARCTDPGSGEIARQLPLYPKPLPLNAGK